MKDIKKYFIVIDSDNCFTGARVFDVYEVFGYLEYEHSHSGSPYVFLEVTKCKDSHINRIYVCNNVFDELGLAVEYANNLMNKEKLELQNKINNLKITITSL